MISDLRGLPGGDQLNISAIREILSGEDFISTSTNPDALAMSTAETNVELLRAFDRLLDLLRVPQDLPFPDPKR